MPVSFAIIQLLMLILPVGAIVFFGWLGLRYVRARERQEAVRTEVVMPTADMARLQDMLLTLQTDMEAMRERQEFLEKLLERPREQQR